MTIVPISPNCHKSIIFQVSRSLRFAFVGLYKLVGHLARSRFLRRIARDVLEHRTVGIGRHLVVDNFSGHGLTGVARWVVVRGGVARQLVRTTLLRSIPSLRCGKREVRRVGKGIRRIRAIIRVIIRV
jgi:hypothetical protein